MVVLCSPELNKNLYKILVDLKRIFAIYVHCFLMWTAKIAKNDGFVVVPCSPELSENLYKFSVNLKCIIGILLIGF